MRRVKLKAAEAPAETSSAGASDYFPDTAANMARVPCVPTGCSLLDCVLGGGWAQGRVANIVGDKSVGKSLLAIEACANFALLEPKGRIYYRESEAAFDLPYAEALGLPVKRVDFGPDGTDSSWDTIEDIFEDLSARLEECASAKVPGLYIIDSLDALSSRAEMERKPGEASFGLEKQKMLGQLFRQLVRRLKAQNFCVLVISQIRDKIGVTFGEKHSRSGGKALDFYASQIVWLSHLGYLHQTSRGVKRAVGVRIKAKCKKNKVAASFRECEFSISFGFGVDDVGAGVAWLEEVRALGRLGLSSAKDVDAFLSGAAKATGRELSALRAQVAAAVTAEWVEVEKRFVGGRKKYGE